MSTGVKAFVILVAVLACGAHSASAADIVWVNEFRGGGGGTDGPGQGALTWEEDQWRALLEDNGHNIIAHGFFMDVDTDPAQLDVLNSADLVIMSRDSNSGEYNSTPEEIEIWTEGITVPMLVLTPFHMRTSRWLMVDALGTPVVADPLEALDPSHPVFEGVPLDANNQVEVWDDTLLGPDDNINVTDAADAGNGTLVAVEAFTENPWIIHWEEGVEFFDGSGTFAGGPRMFFGAGSDDDPNSWGEKNLTPEGDQIFLNAVNFMAGEEAGPQLQAGDANMDCKFDTLDIVQVSQRAKYLTAQAATWGDGDWDAAPGGSALDQVPPTGNGQFDQLDIIAALAGGQYLQGSYCADGFAAIAGGGDDDDEQTSIIYDARTGEVGVDAPASTNLTSVNIDSAGGIFANHENAQNLDGSFDTHSDSNIFKATFGSSFGDISFGTIATPGLSPEDIVAADLTVIGSLEGGGGLGDVDLIYIPEPSTVTLLVFGLVGLVGCMRRRECWSR